MSNYNNYGLFERYLDKVKTTTISKFGSLGKLQVFLRHMAEQGNVLLAVKNSEGLKLSPLEIAKLIKADRYLAKAVVLAQDYATEVVEAVLYDRAINGYEELTFDKDGNCVARKRKYCSKSLLEYLKANSPKYCSSKNNSLAKKSKAKRGATEHGAALQPLKTNTIPSFEVESYEIYDTRRSHNNGFSVCVKYHIQ
jgi:hypothetical protein